MYKSLTSEEISRGSYKVLSTYLFAEFHSDSTTFMVSSFFYLHLFVDHDHCLDITIKLFKKLHRCYNTEAKFIHVLTCVYRKRLSCFALLINEMKGQLLASFSTAALECS